uniref:Uncharacterized protein n=1 Tax=Setaria digitata TaxID=48799 RepID=A0A915Q2H6_9BILA
MLQSKCYFVDVMTEEKNAKKKTDGKPLHLVFTSVDEAANTVFRDSCWLAADISVSGFLLACSRYQCFGIPVGLQQISVFRDSCWLAADISVSGFLLAVTIYRAR